MIIRIVKKIIFALVVIYSFDIIFKGFGIIIPINYYTVPIIAVLGFPGLVMLALSFFFLL